MLRQEPKQQNPNLRSVTTARMQGFLPFVIPSRLAFSTFDFKRINALSDAEFADRYLGEMTRYFFEHGRHRLEQEEYARTLGLDRGLKPIACWDCPNPIESPRDLRRYYGANLHHACFLKCRENDEKGEDKRTREYWSRVAALNL